MKKLFAIALASVLTFALAACATVRNTPPSLVGANENVTITQGDTFNPLDGITATDDQDGDLTSSIQVEGYNAAWTEQQGTFSYIISVTDSEGLIAQVTVHLTVESETGNATPTLSGVFNNQTYYIGSTAFDPIRGITASDAEDGDLTDAITYTQEYSTTRAGRYTILVSVTDADGAVASETISLTVKAAVAIPTELTTDPITITLWHSNGDTIETAMESYAEDFHALYPNITVNIVKNGNNYDELRQNVINAIKGGELPNIVQNYPDHVMEYIDNRALISLTPYIESSNWGYTTGDDSFMDILESYRRENSQYTTDGEYYSVPFNKSTEVMIYNKTMIDQLIANGTIDEMPTTWQGLFAIADDLTAISGDMIDDIVTLLNKSSNESLHKTPEEVAAMKASFVPFSYDSEANAFITLIRQWGGLYTSIDTARLGVIEFDNAEARSMLTYFYENRDILTLPDFWGSDYASDIFKLGQTAVTFGSTGGARYNTPDIVTYTEGTETITASTFEVGIAPMPYNADLPENFTAIQQGTNMSITTAGTDQQKLASWLFLKYLTSKEVQLDFALTTGYSPVRASVYDEPEYILFTQGYVLGNDGVTQIALTGENLVKSLAANAAAQQAHRLFFDQAFVGSSATRTAVGVAFARVVLSTETGITTEEIIDDAIAAAVAEANRVLGN